MGLKSFVSKITGDIPIVGDLINAAAGHASAKNLQNDAQAHDSHMFHAQAGHDKDMFGLESEFASAQAAKQYERQRALLQDSPRLQMEGLKSAGLNPILAATGGFKSPAGGSLPIPSARASSSAKGAGQSSPPGAKLALGQYRLLMEQANLASAQAKKVESEKERVDVTTSILRLTEEITDLLREVVGLAKDNNGRGAIHNYQEAQRIRQDVIELTPDAQKEAVKARIDREFREAQRKVPYLKGVKPSQRKPFGFGSKK
jgi:hypothetical protein